MITINTRILSTVALGLALAACNNGGGGGGGGGGGPVTVKKQVFDSTEVKTDIVRTQDDSGKLLTAEYTTTTNADKPDTLVVTVDGATNKITSAKLNGEAAVIGGNFYQAWANPVDTTVFDATKPIGYLVFSSASNGPSVIISGKTEDMINSLSGAGYRAASKSGQTQFTGINYDYTYSDADGKWQNKTGKDGTVTLQAGSAGTWNAKLGDVTLDGTYYGKRVAGTSTLNGVEGTFSGYDAYKDSDKTHDTRGAFGGAKDTTAYGGVWAKKETLK